MFLCFFNVVLSLDIFLELAKGIVNFKILFSHSNINVNIIINLFI